MALPRSKQENNNKPPIEEPGNYEARLKAANLNVASEFKTDSFNNGSGLQYQAIELTWDFDGIELTEKFIRVSTNEKAKLFNRISGLLGRPLTEKDEIDWGVSDKAETNHPLDQYFQAQKDEPEHNAKKGDWIVTGDPKYDGIIGALDHWTVNGEDLIGKSCLLNVTIKNGYNRMDATAASPLPKRSSPRRAPAPTQDDATSGMPT